MAGFGAVVHHLREWDVSDLWDLPSDRFNLGDELGEGVLSSDDIREHR